MSPWRMMNEWGVPTVYLESLLYKYADKLASKGAYVPPLAMAGGFSLEDHVFKALALGAPYVKACCMGRATLAAAMVGNTQYNLTQLRDKSDGANDEDTLLKLFALAPTLKDRFGSEFKEIPAGAIGMLTYIDRLTGGLQQMMAGARKFAVQYISRDDIVSLTTEAAAVSGIPYMMEYDQEEAERILE